METSIKKLPKSQIEILVRVPVEEFNNFVEKATLDLGKELEIKGFRKGKVSKEIVEKEIGPGRILEEAANQAIKENYFKAISENKIEAISKPEIEVLKLTPGNPFEFKAKISVLPEVKLPDYKQIASQVKRREVVVTKEEIERLRTEKERIEKERVRQEILDKIAENSQIEISEVLVESEKKRMLESLKQQVPQILQIKFEDYLAKIQKTEKELLDSFLPEAQRKIKNSLVLKEIERRENIEVSEKEIKEEIDKISKIYPDLDQNQLKEYSESVIRNKKTFQFLENFVK
ncbi:MAG: trigger factor [Candidatus Nealsonbacteria bacterium]